MSPSEIKEQVRREIIGVINANDWTQADAAEKAGVAQCRINDIVRGRIHKTDKRAGRSLEFLIEVAARLGIRIDIVATIG